MDGFGAGNVLVVGGMGTYDTQSHEELDDHDHDHEAQCSAFAEGVVVDLRSKSRSESTSNTRRQDDGKCKAKQT